MISPETWTLYLFKLFIQVFTWFSGFYPELWKLYFCIWRNPVLSAPLVVHCVSDQSTAQGIHSKTPVGAWNCRRYWVLHILFSLTYTELRWSLICRLGTVGEYPNCQHYHPCALGLLLSKIGVTPEHKHRNTTTANLITRLAGWLMVGSRHDMDMLDQRMIRLLDGTEWTGTRFHGAA